MLILGIPYEFSLLTDTTNIQDYVVTSIAEKGHSGQRCTATLICDSGQLRYSRLGESAKAVGSSEGDFCSEDKVCFILSEPGSHYVAQNASNWRFSCLNLPSAEITGICHHTSWQGGDSEFINFMSLSLRSLRPKEGTRANQAL